MADADGAALGVSVRVRGSWIVAVGVAALDDVCGGGRVVLTLGRRRGAQVEQPPVQRRRQRRRRGKVDERDAARAQALRFACTCEDATPWFAVPLDADVTSASSVAVRVRASQVTGPLLPVRRHQSVRPRPAPLVKGGGQMSHAMPS